jgi:methyl-accepting chemotaxis protein
MTQSEGQKRDSRKFIEERVQSVESQLESVRGFFQKRAWDMGLIAELEGSWKEFLDIRNKVLSITADLNEANLLEAQKIFVGPCHTSATQLLTISNKISEQMKLSLDRESAGHQRTLEILNATTMFGLPAILLSLFFLGRAISQRVTSSISSGVQNLSHQMRLFDERMENLKRMSERLSSASTQSSASLEEIVASMEEISSQVQLNSQNMQQTLEVADQTSATVASSTQDMQSLGQAIHELVTEAERIRSVAHVIDDIAFQTNLLALNAAVEAARAGEQGRGFAVVADAVRTLAQKSMSSSAEVGQLIEKNLSLIQKLKELGEKTETSLLALAEDEKRVTTLTQENAIRSKEQSAGIEQVSQALNEIDQAVQANAAITNELHQLVQTAEESIRAIRVIGSELQALVGSAQGEASLSEQGRVKTSGASLSRAA